MELNKIALYRITHIKNIPHILRFGVTHRLSVNANQNFVPIGDRSLINFRDKFNVEVGAKTINLGQFIPFYFGIRMPMLYTIQHGYNFTTPVAPHEIVYVVVSLQRLIDDSSIPIYFTDGHAVDAFTNFYGRGEIEDLPRIIDWDAVKLRQWSGSSIDIDAKRRKQAECLVGCDIPPEYIVGFGCYNIEAADTLAALGIDKERIKIIPQAYY